VTIAADAAQRRCDPVRLRRVRDRIDGEPALRLASEGVQVPTEQPRPARSPQ
jgi:hypothetical protein